MAEYLGKLQMEIEGPKKQKWLEWGKGSHSATFFWAGGRVGCETGEAEDGGEASEVRSTGEENKGSVPVAAHDSKQDGGNSSAEGRSGRDNLTKHPCKRKG